jgi:hypothetical protein
MRIRVAYIATIDDQEMLDAGVNITNLDEIADYFYENGGEDSFHDHGEKFEIIP